MYYLQVIISKVKLTSLKSSKTCCIYSSVFPLLDLYILKQPNRFTLGQNYYLIFSEIQKLNILTCFSKPLAFLLSSQTPILIMTFNLKSSVARRKLRCGDWSLTVSANSWQTEKAHEQNSDHVLMPTLFLLILKVTKEKCLLTGPKVWPLSNTKY